MDLPTVGDTRKDCPGGVRVWCHNKSCERADREIIVGWDKIKAPDQLPFIHLRFRCSLCGGDRVTFQPLWPMTQGMGPEKNFR